jgi:general stress protein YciG
MAGNDGKKSTSNRGFASMDQAKQREIASKGGQSVPPEKRSFSQDPQLAAQAGRKGGESVPPQGRSFSQNRGLAAEAGRKGGQSRGAAAAARILEANGRPGGANLGKSGAAPDSGKEPSENRKIAAEGGRRGADHPKISPPVDENDIEEENPSEENNTNRFRAASIHHMPHGGK